MPQFNPHNYMDPNAGYRYYNGEYYLYTPTKIQNYEGFSAGLGGTVQKLTPEEVQTNRLNQNNTFRAVIDPTTWSSNGRYTPDEIRSGVQSAFAGFDSGNTTGWQGQMDNLVQQATNIYNQDPSRMDKVFGDVWNNFRNSNLPAIQNLQAQNNPARPEFTSQGQAQMYGQSGQMTTQEQRDQMARYNVDPQTFSNFSRANPGVQPNWKDFSIMGGANPASVPGVSLNNQNTGPTTTRLNPATGLLEKVPVSTLVADKLPMQVSSTVSPDQLATNTSPAGLFPTTSSTASAKATFDVGNLGLSALDQAIFKFQAQQQELASGQRQQAENAVTQAQQGLANIYNTSRESEITRILQEAGVKEKQAALSDLKMKMAQAQEALNLGVQQENGRIAPMSIIGRRQQLLVEQAQGKIGALAAIANVYADDLDQAWNVANITIDAMNQDRQEKINAYQFLITANENKIVSLKAEEKDAINSQIKILQDAQAKAEVNKNKVMELITKNPIEAQKAKVSLTDTYEQAMAKIQPLVAKRAETEYALQLEGAKLDVQLKKVQIQNIQSEMRKRNSDTSGSDVKVVKINGVDYVQNKDGTFSVPVIQGQTINTAVTAGLKDKVSQIDKLIKQTGAAGSSVVGPSFFGRAGENFLGILNINKLTGAQQEFVGGVHQLVSKETLDSLLNLKKAGGTLGALSDQERIMLQNSATKISDWEKKDKNGVGKGVWDISESAFKKELQTLKTLTQRAITGATASNGLINNLEQNLAANPQRVSEYNALVKANPGATEDQINQLMGF
jgi:hypothetical protein